MKVLVVAAHPDDEILGCGGTIAKLHNEGFKIYALILGEGITARETRRNMKKQTKDIQNLKKQIIRSHKIIGIAETFNYNFPDNRFDTVALLDIIKVIEKIKLKVNPEIIYTHHWADLNIDHRVTYNAVLTACRPIKGETVKKIYSFEVPSSSEWNYPSHFNPNTFVDISKSFVKKIKAIRCYRGELKRFPHPRSEEALRLIARRWGSLVGFSYAEAFCCIRVVQ